MRAQGTLVVVAVWLAWMPGALGAREKLESRVTVWVERRHPTNSAEGVRIGRELLLPLNSFALMGLDPWYDAGRRTITLVAPGWVFRGGVGSRAATLGGAPVTLPVAPQLREVRPTQDSPAMSVPFVPALPLARRLGYHVRFVERLGGIGPVFRLTAPDYFLPLKDFAKQRVTRAEAPPSGDLTARVTQWAVDRRIPQQSLKEEFFLGFWISVTNSGSRPYVGSDKYIYLLMADGAVWTGQWVTSSQSARDLTVTVMPGETETIRGGTWGFPVEGRVPIRRIVYMDGIHRFEWNVEERAE